ncbi:MAG: SdiA-regulated domain-containing protein, partial [Roseimicrobium sp.]
MKMKKILLSLTAVLLSHVAFALAPGDIAFVGINATNPDQFAILVKNTIAPGDTFYVTDGGYTGAMTGVVNTTFRGTEGFLQYTAPAEGVSVGSVLLFNAGDGVSANATVTRNGGGAAGTVSLLTNGTNNTTFSFSTSGDQLTAYTLSSGTYLTGNPNLIAFIDVATNPYGAGGSQLSSIPTISGGQVLDLANIDNAIFTDAANAYSQSIAALSNAANFSTREATAYDLTTLSSAPSGATLAINDVTAAETNAGTTTFSFTVTRSDNTGAFSVNYATTDGTATTAGNDYVATSGTLSFTAGGALTESVVVTVNGDATYEGNEAFTVALSNVVNTTGTATISDASGTGTITDDDVQAPTFTSQPAGTTIATGYTATLSLVATGAPTPTVQWYQGAVGTTTTPVGTNSSTFTTPALTATTSYWARVTNTGGSADSSAAMVTVTPGVASVDLYSYVRVARYNLPEYRRTALPAGTAAHNLLCDEASGVAYNWDTDTLFICGDGGRSITQVTKTGQLVDTMSLELNVNNPQGTEFYDPEGITYVGSGQFVFSEERERRLVKFTYAAGTTLTRANAQTVDIGTFDDNTGTEGLSYDSQTSGFIVLKEKTPIGVFQTGVDFNAGTATNGSAATVNSTNLFDTTLLGMSDVADVFAFSNIPTMTGQAQAGNLLIVGQENARILNVDRSGNILSSLNISADVGDTINVADMQHEGITMDRAGLIYVVNENGGGNIQFPQLWVYAPSSVPNTAPTAVAVNNALNTIQENTSTASPIKVGDLVVTDDGLGNNTFSLAGADAASFQITGSALYLKSGVVLDFEVKTSYAVTINVDDATVGATPDATANFTLTVTDQVVEATAPPALIVTEVAPWSSGNSPGILADWFEVTNVSAATVDITGWKVDDNNPTFPTAVALNGITSIAPGESVIFLESSATNLPATVIANFKSVWFGGNPPAGLQVGTYQGSGIGLSTSGDAVNLFTAAGVLHSGVTFAAADGVSPYQTFDNTAAAGAVSRLSVVGVNGAFVAATSAVEIGSPGYAAPGVLRVTEVAPWSSGNSPVGADWFEVTNIGARSVDVTGWKVDDNSESPAAALPLTGITSIAPGESVIFIETGSTQTAAGNAAAFRSNWFGASPPAALQVGAYTGSGIGLGTSGDAVNLYDTNNVRRVNVAFSTTDSAAPYSTFDNAASVNLGSVSLLSAD